MRLLTAHALTICNGLKPFLLLCEPRAVLPSIAMISFDTSIVKEVIHERKHSSNSWGSINEKILPNVSCEGIPFGNSKNVFSQSISYYRLNQIIQSAAIATFAAGYANDVHRLFWRKLKSLLRRKG